MKVPINWLKDYVALPANPKTLTDKLTMIGHMLDKKSEYKGEEIIDLELRGNRADCYSIYGIAREVASAFGTKLTPPPVLSIKKGNLNTKLSVKTDLVKRVGMLEVTDVVITKSPKWLSQRLEAYGMESVNNIVDLTNYVMLETGEPMHAFDQDKIGYDLQIRLAKDDEKMVTFQGSEITLTKEDLVWAKGSTVLSVAGAIGEKFNSISTETKNILVEAANYDRANIRRSVYRHKLFTEAGIRHEKDLDPNMVNFALERFLYLLSKNKWGVFKPVYYDYYPKKVDSWKIKLTVGQINQLGGVNLPKNEIIKILKNLGFGIIKADGNDLTVNVPTHRTDVIIPEDVIEEVLRIYGYDNIPAKTLSLEIPPDITPAYILQEDKVRYVATSISLSEAITLSFVSEDLLKLNRNPNGQNYTAPALINPPSPDTKFLRQSLFPNLLSISKKIIDERGTELRLFEIGKVYTKSKNIYLERRSCGFIYWKKDNNNFRSFKGILEAFFEKANLPQPNFELTTKDFLLTNTYDIKYGKSVVGFGGQVDNIYYAEINLDEVLGKDVKYPVSLWPKYPPQIEDLTIIFPEKTNIGTFISQVKSLSDNIEQIELKDVFQSAYTFRIWYQDKEKTLKGTEVAKIHDKIISLIINKFAGSVKE